MIDFSAISKKTCAGSFLRLILKLIPSFYIITIKQGIIKGCKWIKGSGVNGYWLGNYEKAEQKIFAQKVKKDDVVFDIGANVGFYSLLASKIVGINGKVYAFEPAPVNLYYLKKHLKLNNCANSIVVVGAVSDKNDMVYFNEGDHAATGHISKDGDSTLVPTFYLDKLIEDKMILSPNLMKIDVEGAEFSVLSGGKNMLDKYHPTIFLSTHNQTAHQQCLNLLLSLNYKLASLNNLDIEKTSEVLATY